MVVAVALAKAALVTASTIIYSDLNKICKYLATHPVPIEGRIQGIFDNFREKCANFRDSCERLVGERVWNVCITFITNAWISAFVIAYLFVFVPFPPIIPFDYVIDWFTLAGIAGACVSYYEQRSSQRLQIVLVYRILLQRV